MLDANEIVAKARLLQRRHRETDQRWQDVRAARNGDFDRIFPDLVSEDFPKPIIANFIDVAARDLAEVLAPLPAFNCSSASMVSDAARKFADKRSKIAQWYVEHSKLGYQMLWGADHYLTYGVCVFYLEPDFEYKTPRIVIEDPVGGYPEYDRWGRTVSYTKRRYTEAAVLARLYPEYASEILEAAGGATDVEGNETQVEIIRYCDDRQISLVLVAESPLVLASTDTPWGECPVVVATKPWLDLDAKNPKGQFDDVIWVQFARDMLAKLNLEAVQKAVQAPLALPNDVQELPYGPDAILRTQTPEKVRRVGLDLTPAAFTESASLLEEMREGTRYPGVRSGGTDASIITGKGVQALLGGFDSQIKSGQLAFQVAFTEVVRKCFLMDEKIWPNTTKEVRCQSNGSPFEISYKPSRDINGDYTCDVSYGFAAGLDPNRAVVLLLQLRAEKLFSRDYFARQLPFELNVSEELRKVNVEDTRDALMQSMFGYVQSIPALAQMGQDPSEAVARVASIVRGLQRGSAIEDVVSQVFPPPAPQLPAQPGQAPPGDGSAGPGGADNGMVSGGLTNSGLMRGVPEGQAGQAPGGRPDLSVMLAGLTGAGNPQMSDFVMRRRRV